MTRTHYNAIAKIIKKNRSKNDATSWRMIKKLADYFTTIDNSRFNRQEFLTACL